MSAKGQTQSGMRQRSDRARTFANRLAKTSKLRSRTGDTQNSLASFTHNPLNRLPGHSSGRIYYAVYSLSSLPPTSARNP